MDAMEVIKTRRSVRTFKDTPIPRASLEAIIDCARMAPTARGEQPWEFVVVTDADTRRKIAGMTSYGSFIARSPACVAVFCKDTTYYLEDGCAATENILLAAWAQGIGSCWVAGDKKPYAEDVRKLLGAPAGYKLVSLLALGYPAEPPGPKQKRPLAELLHWEAW